MRAETFISESYGTVCYGCYVIGYFGSCSMQRSV
jgi:hypothetical protein